MSASRLFIGDMLVCFAALAAAIGIAFYALEKRKLDEPHTTALVGAALAALAAAGLSFAFADTTVEYMVSVWALAFTGGLEFVGAYKLIGVFQGDRDTLAQRIDGLKAEVAEQQKQAVEQGKKLERLQGALDAFNFTKDAQAAQKVVSLSEKR